MQQFTRRSVLGSTVGAAAVFAGCSESSSSGSFTRTAVEDQQLVVEFEESLEAETISVVDPAGEAFAETSVSAGVSRVTFDIELPYAPGEYRIVAADSDETVAETAQEIRPELEIVDVGVGANRMDEMPEDLGHTKDDEAIVHIKNTGSGPEHISGLQFLGDLPNPEELGDDQIGIYDPDKGGRVQEPIRLGSGDQRPIFSSNLPFSFEGDGIDCSTESQEGRIEVEVRGVISGWTSVEYLIEYSAGDSYNDCDISLQETE